MTEKVTLLPHVRGTFLTNKNDQVPRFNILSVWCNCDNDFEK